MTTRAPGERVGRYELVRRIGVGGWGEVWEAVLHGPEGFRRPVALKLRRGSVDAESGARSLLREARLGASVQHPNVVAVHDVGAVDGTPFVAMELVVGLTLSAAMADGPLPLRAVIEAGLQVCAALVHLHAAGLLHRDVKPSNLILDRFATVKLADLGIARRAEEDLGGVSGTPGYAPPEQLAGSPPDVRSDLFAAAATLVALVQGAPPLGLGAAALGRTPRVDALVADGLLGSLPPELRAALAPFLRADPAARPGTAAELGAALAVLDLPDGDGLREVLARFRPDLAAGRVAGPPAPRRQVPDEPTVGLVSGNLPAARDRLFGRTDEIASLAERIRARERLVTLLGPGGAGKTRLALAVARELQPDLPGGSWFVDLADARDTAAACAAAARALSVVELDRDDPVRQLGRVLAYRGRALVVLDNLEQLAPEAASVVGRWVDLAPEASFLVTSRVALRLQGERRFPVDPLPDDAAADLFVERAARRPAIAERADVLALVRSLDGLPLAIELAAARTRVFSVARIRERLARRLDLLVDGDRDRPARHRSLVASLEGSWELLQPAAREVLPQLTVFDGGATLPAIEGVAAPSDGWPLEALEELVDASLVRVDADGERFRLLATVQEWARTHLADDARRAAEGRHRAYYATWGSREALRRVDGPGAPEWIAEVAADLDNLRVACARGVEAGDGPGAAAVLLGAGAAFVSRGPLLPWSELAARVAALPLPDPARRAVEQLRAQIHLSGGRFAAAAPHLEAALVLAAATGDVGGEVLARAKLAFCRAMLGGADAADAEALATLAIEQAAASGDRHLVATTWREAGGAAWATGRHAVALERMGRARDGFAAVGDPRGEGTATYNLAVVSSHLGHNADARRWGERAAPLLARVGDLRNLGLLRIHQGMTELADGSPVAARPHFADAADALAAVGDERSRATALAHLGLCLRELGRPDLASAPLLEARRAQEGLGDERDLALTCWHLANHHHERGELAAASALLDEAVDRATRAGLHRAVPQLQARRAAVVFDAGDRAAARASAAEAVAAARASQDWAALAQSLGSAAVLALRDDDPAGARALLDEAVAHVPGGTAGFVALRAHVGEARARTGDRGGLDELRRAVGELEAGGNVPSRIEALLQLARAQVDLGDPAGDALAAADALLDLWPVPPGAPLRALRDRVAGVARGPGGGAR